MKHTCKKSLRTPKEPKKENFDLSRAGAKFQPSNFGDARGNEQGWVSKLPFFSKKG